MNAISRAHTHTPNYLKGKIACERVPIDEENLINDELRIDPDLFDHEAVARGLRSGKEVIVNTRIWLRLCHYFYTRIRYAFLFE